MTLATYSTGGTIERWRPELEPLRYRLARERMEAQHAEARELIRAMCIVAAIDLAVEMRVA